MEQKAGTTLYEFLESCLKAVEIYENIEELFGQDGDIGASEMIAEQNKKLQKTVKDLRNEWQVSRLVGISAVRKWLIEDISEEDKETLLDALKEIEQDRKYKIDRYQEELIYIQKFM